MWREQWHKDNFLFEHDCPEDFTRCFWQRNPKVLPIWLAYRLLILLYFLVILPCMVFLKLKEGHIWYKNILYVSSMNTVSQVLLYGLLLGFAVVQFVKEKKNPELPPMETMPWYYKALWILYTMVTSTSVVISFLFWFFVYDARKHTNLWFLITCRLLNGVFVILDFVLSAIPYRFLHFYLPCLYVLSYVMFTCLYQISGGTGNRNHVSIYKILDWREPENAVPTVIVTMVCNCLSHFALYALHLVKFWLKKWREDRGNAV